VVIGRTTTSITQSIQVILEKTFAITLMIRFSTRWYAKD